MGWEEVALAASCSWSEVLGSILLATPPSRSSTLLVPPLGLGPALGCDHSNPGVPSV